MVRPALLRRSTSPPATRTRQRPHRPCPAHGAGTSNSQMIAASSRLVPWGTSIVSPDGVNVIVAIAVRGLVAGVSLMRSRRS